MKRSFTIPRILTVLVLFALAAPSGAAAQQKRGVEPDDYYRVRRVSSTEISPDGRYLLYTVQTVRQAQNDRLTEVWWADLETGKNQRLSTAGVNTTNPHWTPDGKRIWLTTTRGDETGVHFINFLEPGGEAYKLPGLQGNPIFSPDGRWILFTRNVAPEDAPRQRGQQGAQRPQAPSGQERPAQPDGPPGLARPPVQWAGTTEETRNDDVFVITNSNYKRNGVHEFITGGGGGFGGGRGGDFGGFGGQGGGRGTPQFFRMPATGLEEGQEAEQLTSDDMNKSFAGYSADGRWIVFTVSVAPEPTDEEQEGPPQGPFGGGNRETQIWRMPADGGEATLLATLDTAVRGLTIAPDASRFAYSINDDRQEDPILRVIDDSGKTLADIGEGWVYGFGSVTFTPDAAKVLWLSQIGGQDQVCSAPATGGPITRVTQGRHSLGSLSFDRAMTKMAYAKDTAEMPWEAFVARADGSGERQVSQVNTAWLEEVALSKVERFTFEGAPHNEKWLADLRKRGVDYMMEHPAKSGMRPEIEAWLMYPLEYEEGKKYPMVLSIHGGPHSMYAETWFPEFQMLAAQGMFVLYINPRGSGGYGRYFSNMIMEAWGIDDYKDYMQAVDMVVDRGLADPEKLGVTGGSYGGYMTNWITAHTTRFKAAITARSIANWISFYGVSDASGLVESEFGGRPWPFRDPKEGSYDLAMMLSPIVWADRVTTPTLIVHSINDYRVPLPEAEQWFRALQKNNVPVKMVLFPDSDHDLSRTGEPWLLVRRLKEYKDWFKAYLVDDEPVIPVRGR